MAHAMRILFVSLAVTLALSACKPSPPSTDAPPGAVVTTTVPLRIATAQGARIFSMELAISEAEQERGLMHRPPLPQGRGMLFPFALPRTISFWMKDTPAPLDLLFMRPDGTVAAILHGKPDDRTPLSAGEPVSAVVEIGAGEAERLGIRPGDRVEWGDCSQGRMKPGEPLNPLAFCPATAS
jgi:uncharacterized membrane protein (UPF0127 family)